MITKKTALLVVVLGALAAWLASAATSGLRPARSVAARPQIDVRGAALADEVERLHDRLRPTATPEHGRNLFQFAASRAVAAPPAAVDAPPPAPAASVEPRFKLIGVAEDGGTRTAILSAPGQLLMVKASDVVGAYRVAGISADAIELTATADGTILRLALK